MTQPPHNLELEYAALYRILAGDAYLLSHLRPEDFHDPSLRRIFDACYQEFTEHGQCDFNGVDHRLKGLPWYEERGGSAFLATLVSSSTWPFTTGPRLLEMLRDLHVRRMAAGLGAEGSTAAEVVESLSDRLEHMRVLLPTAPRELGAVLRGLLDAPPRSIPFGFPCLDDMVTMHPGQLVVVGARPGVGKSSFLCNVACNYALTGKPIVYCTKEMSYEELLPRFLAYLSGKPFRVLREGALEYEKTLARIQVEETMETVSDIEAIALHSDAEVIVVDYIQLLTVRGRRPDSRVQELEEITRRLKGLAQRTGKVVLCASQLNRDSETGNRRPSLSDLRGSGSIEMDANTVILMYDPFAKDEDDDSGASWQTRKKTEQAARSFDGQEGMIDFLVRKNRSGRTGNVKLKWIPELTTFRDLTNLAPHPAHA